MFAYIFSTNSLNVVFAIGLSIVFFATFFFLKKGLFFLPKDGGRDVTGGQISKGKPTGAGIIFIIIFDIAVLLFTRITPEIFIYLILITATMVVGFLDDAATKEWGRLKKGLFDLSVAVVLAITYLHFNPSTVTIAFNNTTIFIHPFFYALLIILLTFTSINVTNCADGVDGLTGSLSFVTIFSMMSIMRLFNIDPAFVSATTIMLVCIAIYLWFNASPSRLMMGDAGSRSIGLFIAICAIKTHHPFLYILLAIMLLLDGGIGLVKIVLIRATKKKVLSSIRTPLHDHARKIKGWSDTQVVFRFLVIQLVVSLGVIAYML